ncbi:MAG: universal stress protein [Dehalococcoidia bacterium]
MYTQILVPLDGSETSERALPHAQDLAQAFGATLHLLQAISRAEELDIIRSGDASALEQEYSRDSAQRLIEARKGRAEQYLSQTAARLGTDGLQVKTSLLEGEASEKIDEYVTAQNIDLIVMSTHGHGGLRRFLTGSVTDRVIRSVAVPVLAVPPA